MAAAMFHLAQSALRSTTGAMAVLLALACLNCSNNQNGIGIGRQPVPNPSPGTPALPVTFVEIYAADPDPAQTFVELLNPSTQPVSLDGLSLCKDLESPCLPVTGTVAPGARVSFSLETLGVRPESGEIALVNSTNEALAYLAWGSDPTFANSPLFLAAYYSGAWTPGAFAPASFPSPTGFASVLEGDESGCAAPTRDTEPVVPVPVCPASTRVVRITEVAPSRGLTGFSSFVEVENISPNPLNIDGVLLCVGSSCVPLGADVVPAGERRYVILRESVPTDIDGNPTPAPGALYQPIAPPLPAAGEVGIVAPGGRVIEQGRMQSFVRYGDTAPTAVSPIAVLAGLWATDADAAPTSTWPTDSVIRDPAGDPATDVGAAGWFLAKRSPGAADTLPTTTPWELCSLGDPTVTAGLPARNLVIAAVARLDASRTVVYLENTTGADLPLTGIEVFLGAVSLPLPAGPLPAGEQVALLLGSATDCTGDALTAFAEEATAQNPTGNPNPLTTACTENDASTADGELTVTSLGAPNDYLQWGSPTVAAEAPAIAAGLWPASQCGQSALGELAGLVLEDVAADGNVPSDYGRTELAPLIPAE